MRLALISPIGFASMLLLTLVAGPVGAQSSAGSLQSAVISTLQVCRAFQQAEGALAVSAVTDLGYRASRGGFEQSTEGAALHLSFDAQGCRLKVSGDIPDFEPVVRAIADAAQAWVPAHTVHDFREPTGSGRNRDIRTFIGWQSDDKSRNELLVISEPARPGRGERTIAYAWFTQ